MTDTTLKGISKLTELSLQDIKLVFFDIDGTLVRCDHSVSDQSITAINHLFQAGIKVGLASGRPVFAAQHLFELLPLTGPHLFFSGALLLGSSTEEILASSPLSSDLVHSVLADRESVYLELYTTSGFYISEPHPYAKIHAQYLGLEAEQRDFTELVKATDIVKIGIIGPEETIEQTGLMKRLRVRSDIKVASARGAAHPDLLFINITSTVADRTAAFAKLIQHVGCTPSEVICFGDGESDIPFLQATPYGIAMGNAADVVKEHAAIVTKSVEEDGVAYAIEQLLGTAGAACR